MFDIDVTDLVSGADEMIRFSASAAELGENAGAITWRNAVEHASENRLVSNPEWLEELRDWFAEFGAWERETIDNWSDNELNALLLQFIAGDVREMAEHAETYEEYQQGITDGHFAGRLYRHNERWFYSVSN